MGEKALGSDRPATASILKNHAVLLQAQGDLTGARPLFERALAIRETATSLNNLAALLRDQGDFAGTRSLYERVLAIRVRLLGPEHLDTATRLDNVVLALHCDFAAARPR